MDSTTIIVLAIALIALGFVFKRRQGAAEIIPEEEIHRDLAAGATVVDVRTPGEFAAGHADGAINIPLNEVARRADEFTAFSQPVLLCCRTGRRSGGATLILRRRGIGAVKNAGAYQRVVSGENTPDR
ncbi:MAG: rhodanese-like domain-containing protein [Spirochaeta sp.]|jgi:phage shock protein E|nr:rhodanese-like domain-containing protein [Spirochaeta sp.]